MKKFLSVFVLILILCFPPVFADDITLQGYVQEVPNEFFGTWRVSAKRVETNSPAVFKEKTVDLWNIIKFDNVIKLSNPFSGASAQINVTNSEDKRVEFSKKGAYGNQILTDTVDITIVGDRFVGYDTLKLDTTSEIDGSIRKTSTAKYKIIGERIAGQSIRGE